MATSDHVHFNICEVQQEIFEYAVNLKYDLKTFVNVYLKSNFCRRAFDTIYSRFQTADAEECADFFLPEIEKNLVKATSQNAYDSLAGDIGFMYRLLYIKTSVPSANLVQIIPFEEMVKRALSFDYYGFDESADKLIEDFGLPQQPYDDTLICSAQEMD